MPTLSIDIEARFAQAIDAVDKLTSNVEKNGKRMEHAFHDLHKAAELFGIALSAGAFIEFIKHSIEAQAKLNDLSKATGVAVETLGGLGFTAQQTGTDLDGVAKAFGKLNINIAKAAAGNEQAGEGFKAMGLSLRDANGHLKTADVLLLQIADKFQGYADGPNKAALANSLFGKSYASILPLLAEGGAKIKQNIDYWTRYSAVTTESARAAVELNEQLAKTNLHFKALGNILANELAAPLLGMAEAFNKLEENSGFVKTLATGFTELFRIITVGGVGAATILQQIGLDMIQLDKATTALEHLDFSAAVKHISDMLAANKLALQDLAGFAERTMHPERFAVVEPATKAGGKKEAPGLPDTAAADKALAERKEILKAQLKVLDAFAAESADILKQHNDDSQRLYDANEIGLRRYFERLEQDRAEALNKQRTALQAEQDALREFAGDTSVPIKDRLEATEKLTAVTERLAKVQRESGEAGSKAFADEKKAAETLFDQISELNAQLLESQGKVVEAAAVRREVANRPLRRALAVNAPGNVPQLDDLERRQAAQDQLNKTLTDSERTFADLGRAEREIQDQLNEGQLTQLEAIERTDRARRAQLPVLEKELEAARALARALQTPEAIDNVLELEQRLRDLQATTDQVGKASREILENAFVDPFTEFIEGTKNAEQAFLSFVGNIAKAIERLAVQNIAQKLFGGIGGMSAATVEQPDNFLAGLIGNIVGSIAGAGFSGGFGGAGEAGRIAGGAATVPGGLEIPSGYSAGGMPQFNPQTVVPAGASAPMINMNISTPDANSFLQSQSQITTAYAVSAQRALARR